MALIAEVDAVLTKAMRDLLVRPPTTVSAKSLVAKDFQAPGGIRRVYRDTEPSGDPTLFNEALRTGSSNMEKPPCRPVAEQAGRRGTQASTGARSACGAPREEQRSGDGGVGRRGRGGRVGPTDFRLVLGHPELTLLLEDERRRRTHLRVRLACQQAAGHRPAVSAVQFIDGIDIVRAEGLRR